MELKKFAPWNWFKKSEDPGKDEEPLVGDIPETIPDYEPSPEEVAAMELFFDKSLNQGFWSSLSATRPATPLTDPCLLRPYLEFIDNKNEYVVLIEIRGARKDDISLQVNGNLLTVTRENHPPRNIRSNGFEVLDQNHIDFSREIQLPEDSDPQRLVALYGKGRLIVTIPKSRSREEKVSRISPNHP